MAYQTLYDFILEHHDGKLSKESLDFYKDLSRYERYGVKTIQIREYLHPNRPTWEADNHLIAVSAVAIIWERNTDHSITVVHKEHRNEGLGSKVLKRKIDTCKARELVFTTIVNDANKPSLGMCKHLGLPVLWRSADFGTREKRAECEYTKFEIDLGKEDFDLEAHVKAH